MQRVQSQLEDPGRRQFLTRLRLWLLAAATTGLVYPLLRFTGYRIPPKPRLVEVPAPLPLSGVHTGHEFFLFVHNEAPVAVSRICTHLGCRTNYQADKGYIECPCHQSRFSSQGQRFAGPAEKNLPTYPVTTKQDAEGRVIAYLVHL